MGFGDYLKGKILDAVPGDASRKVTSALGDGHTTSGMDQALQDHADKLHPVNKSPGDFPARPKYNPNKGEINYP